VGRQDYTQTKAARAEVAAHVEELLSRHMLSGEFSDWAASDVDVFRERRRHAALDRLRVQLRKAAAAGKEAPGA
jgi:hypothetical protein